MNQEEQEVNENQQDSPTKEKISEAKPKDPSLSDVWKKKIGYFCESTAWMIFMGLLTIWTLYEGDIQLAATNQDADLAFEVIISICFFIFSIEIFLQCFYKEDYFNIPSFHSEYMETWPEFLQNRLNIGSFYFWMDIVSTFSLVFNMTWMLDRATNEALNGGGTQNAQGSNAAQVGARVARVVRLARMVRLVRIGKLYKYASALFTKTNKIKQEDDEDSKVGAAMSDLTNRRVIVLILLMIIIIPLLSISDPDISLSLAVQLIHSLAQLNSTDPETYEMGLLLALNITQSQLPVAAITIDNTQIYYDSILSNLRAAEQIEYYLDTNGTYTDIIFNQKEISITTAQFSIYTTSVVIVVLLAGIYSFNADVESLVIRPIEKLVALVKKIADNPLGVDYSVQGEEDGFHEGMETTILLTTINKIGGLMRVGFGEAGAAIIAKNLQESTNGRLNLLGSGTMIYSIFGFCDVRQFTDTTECLQEEVMLFVNRIAHILHSIVVQCSGAANKNIGDAFLLTWKLEEKAMKEQKALLADQALLTFCKALIELARHQEFICNFSVEATGRLFKRFPDYKVRIGSGLHVGWAIEGAIGSNHKIDATYISPHVSTAEFLESSTKEYGVSLLMSEPFYRLLSPAASRFVRQVDRIRRSAEEGPMGLYTYDCDLSIDWNDPFRQRKKSTSGASTDLKGKLRSAARRASALSAQERASVRMAPLDAALSLAPIRERSEKSGSVSGSTNTRSQNLFFDTRKRASKDSTSSDLLKPYAGGRRKSSFAGYNPVPLQSVDEENPLAEQAAEQLKKAKQTPVILVPPYTQNIWVEDEDLVDLRHRVNETFRSVWAEGMDAFIIGDWELARNKFADALRLSKKDGPAKHLLEYLKEQNYQAPDNWPGYRDLGGAGGH